ncbi:hepatoma-derived growth factor [Drosophila virilis]|uniref:hepatoma-derived growth factor n=1 Tax=Drosophila virilis TaxID=7244 RepID=UPI001395F76D|nr:hepatoma-derived growth factor [Drosophila virilis]
MGRKGKKEPKQLGVGDFVFAKVRGFRAWPARVLREDGNMFQVYFYGTCNIAKVGATQLFEYEKCKARLGEVKQKHYGLFREAMLHVEQSLTNPGEDHGYFQAKTDLASDEAELEDDDDDDDKVALASTTPQLRMKKRLGRTIVPFTHITGDSD